MNKYLLLFGLLFLLSFSCKQDIKKVDLIVFNAVVYTVDDKTPQAQAFAIKDGKITYVGNNKSILKKYKAKKNLDAKGKTIIPGIIDAHCHFYRFGIQLQKVNLSKAKSFDEVLDRIILFQKNKNARFIIGKGWNQNDWEIKEFPSKHKLDSLFPDIPIVLKRIDNHALLVNQKTLDLAGVTKKTKVKGGDILTQNGELTGILIDNAMTLVHKIIPKPTVEEQVKALKEAEKINFKYGITTVDDAGLNPNIISLIDSLQQTNELKIRMYAMVRNEPNSVKQYLNKGPYKTDKLNVSSIKVYADGALGSRGAVLKKPYNDKHNHFGAMVISLDKFNDLAKKLADSPFQMNTHAIGDSANAVVINTYKEVLKGQKNRRWRIEHAQVIAPEELEILDNNLIMSVQPTHATSDMYWAEDRLGKERIKGAYAYKSLLNKTGMLALGTDYPVESVNPFYTFYAAVARKDLNQFPENGFQIQDALSRKETLKGMTIWAAYSNFEEDEKGSITKGKYADFVILDEDIMKIKVDSIPYTKVLYTYLGGDKVYEKTQNRLN